ncbi:GPO family capsid scaffolding protein [Vibrio parahaemolyticus]|nr:GPO family capsid scaffolding protein [Vibrio parahaemolyticus]
MSQLQTNWIRIASAGNAIDGRVIDERIIKEMAETYNTDEYQARIWPDHRRWFGAWGDVVALKAEEWQGKWRLFAKLRPNSMLMQANESDQKTYCSIEIRVRDFDGSGKHYLQALGVTDEPGSLGTEKLQFNIDKGGIYSEPESFLIEEVAEEEKPTAFKRVMEFFTKDKQTEPQTNNPTGESTVEKEQFDQIMAGISGISSKQEELENRFSALEEKQEKGDLTEDVEDECKTEGDKDSGKTDSAVSSEDFTKVLGAIEGIASKQEELTKQFNKLSQEVPGQEPDGSGADDKFSVKEMF